MNLAGSSYGNGPLLICLHGLFGSGDNLRAIGRDFERRYTVTYPDLPNHGASPHTDGFSYRMMSESVVRLIDSAGGGAAVLVGHSMGGKVAMRIALDHPRSVRALAVLDMAPRTYDPSHREIMDAMLALPLQEIRSRAEADRMLARSIPLQPVRSFLLKNLVRDDEGYRWRLNLPLLRRDYERVLGWDGTGTYEGPVLFVGGSRSTYVKPERDGRLISSYFPRADIRMVAGAGHWIHSERPAEVRALLSRFLGDTVDAAS